MHHIVTGLFTPRFAVLCRETPSHTHHEQTSDITSIRARVRYSFCRQVVAGNFFYSDTAVQRVPTAIMWSYKTHINRIELPHEQKSKLAYFVEGWILPSGGAINENVVQGPLITALESKRYGLPTQFWTVLHINCVS